MTLLLLVVSVGSPTAGWDATGRDDLGAAFPFFTGARCLPDDAGYDTSVIKRDGVTPSARESRTILTRLMFLSLRSTAPT